MKRTVYGVRYVNSYQDGMALSQSEHMFGSEEERAKFLAEEGLKPEDCDWDDDEGCRDGLEGWQLFSDDVTFPN